MNKILNFFCIRKLSSGHRKCELSKNYYNRMFCFLTSKKKLKNCFWEVITSIYTTFYKKKTFSSRSRASSLLSIKNIRYSESFQRQSNRHFAPHSFYHETTWTFKFVFKGVVAIECEKNGGDKEYAKKTNRKLYNRKIRKTSKIISKKLRITLIFVELIIYRVYANIFIFFPSWSGQI